MSGLVNPFWTHNYGIDDFTEFEAATDPYFNQAFALDPTGVLKQAAQESAAIFPGSAFGLGAAAWLTASGYDGQPARTFMQTIIDALLAAQNQSSGEEPPMPQLIIPDAFQVNIDATSGGQPVTNVVGVRNASGDAAGACAAVRAAWKAANGPLAMLQQSYALTQFKAVDLSSANGDIAVITDTSTGTNGTAALATNAACALIKWNGGTRSRSSRGRLYLGPLSEAMINADGRTLTPAIITAMNGAATVFRNSLNGSGYPLVVLSRTLSQSFDVTSHATETVIATQRRRIRN